MKKNREDEPTGVLKHIYMQIPQGNSLCSHLYLKQAKMSFFSLFSSTKLENGRVKQVLPRRRGILVPVGGGKRANTVQKCAHM
jgi:hypothetical protein